MSALEDPSWTALTEETRDRLLAEHRDIHVSGEDWYEFTVAEFKAEMLTIGFEIERTYWSGFWSQGDGACFFGKTVDLGKLLKAFDPTLPEVVCTRAVRQCPALHVGARGWYSHSGTMYFASCDLELWPTAEDEADPLILAAWRAATESGQILVDREGEILKFLRAKADDLYRRLEAEYEHLTSDEEVVAGILAHELIEEEEEDDLVS